MGEFLMRDRIHDFASITESDCLPGYTFVKQEGIIIMYRLVIDKDTKIAMVKEQISIDSELHVSLSFCGFHVPLPEWFRKAHACKLTRRSMLENFPAYMREKGEVMNPILQEMNELQHYKRKGRPKYSANMIRLETFTLFFLQ